MKQVLLLVGLLAAINAEPLVFKPGQPAPNTMCGDGQTICPGDDTCCRLSSGQYGCCPLKSAVCCPDKVHCCPQGTTCDVSTARCIRKGLEWIYPTYKRKIAPLETETPVATKVGSVVCPDKKSQCPNGCTCCVMTTGEYGCCPIPEAVCCSDKLHCCPKGTTCDTSAGKCIQSGRAVSEWLTKVAAKPRVKNVQSDDETILETVSTKVGSVICPGKKLTCPDGCTCCIMTTGEYGCCPITEAICCPDKVHCCPKGTTCDTSANKCTQSGRAVSELLIKFAAKPRVETVQCNDKFYCPDGTTCCKLSDDAHYGCCPLPSAVCCNDAIHCCPHGYECNGGSCTKFGEKTIAALKKISAIKSELPKKMVAMHTSAKAVHCPDGESQCPIGTTCCKMPSGKYGCCPMPNATCCNDHLHCCPKNYKCDVEGQKCIKTGNDKTDMIAPSLQPIYVAKNNSKNGVKCDSKVQCPDGETCCKLRSGEWGCCPFKNALCCKDHIHCCPSNMKCDITHGRCIRKNGNSLPWAVKRPAMKRVGNIVCPGGGFMCPDSTTCCKTAAGGWGCCPFPTATCCSDGSHCCPNGYTCDIAQSSCKKGYISIPFV